MSDPIPDSDPRTPLPIEAQPEDETDLFVHTPRVTPWPRDAANSLTPTSSTVSTRPSAKTPSDTARKKGADMKTDGSVVPTEPPPPPPTRRVRAAITIGGFVAAVILAGALYYVLR